MVSITKTAVIGHLKLKKTLPLLYNSLCRMLWLSCIMPVSISHNQIFPKIAPPDVVVCRPAVFSMLRSTAGKHSKDVGTRKRHPKLKIRTRTTTPKKVTTYWDLELRRWGAKSR
ncbi:hypothetical protein L873DRAFT_331336 [Choiromyces venosus 120613-1]|uniref:Uncharacterized protein n=1 Tax=Choiromyces venosus 120613-1 TaxID=1336337 RepID=A0A3N4JXA8_9PEZI|nr:hypothetical protein L873DRAFT_331336 [Choiromyces venosus 120613-1]